MNACSHCDFPMHHCDFAVLGSGQRLALSLLILLLRSFSSLPDFICCSPISCHSHLQFLLPFPLHSDSLSSLPSHSFHLHPAPPEELRMKLTALCKCFVLNHVPKPPLPYSLSSNYFPNSPGLTHLHCPLFFYHNLFRT